MGRKGTQYVGKSRSGRARRRLAGAAALVLMAAVLPAVLLGATPAQAVVGCNPHYWWAPFDSTSAWVDSVFEQANDLSCSTSPAIARYNSYSNGSYIAAAQQASYFLLGYRNDDGDPYWTSGGIGPQLGTPGMTGAPSLISGGGGVEFAYTYGNGGYGNDLYWGTAPDGNSGGGVFKQVTTGSKLAPWAPG